MDIATTRLGENLFLNLPDYNAGCLRSWNYLILIDYIEFLIVCVCAVQLTEETIYVLSFRRNHIQDIKKNICDNKFKQKYSNMLFDYRRLNIK